MTKTGKIEWFNNKIGSGLITDCEGRKIEVQNNDIITDGLKTLFKGDIVLYTLRKVNEKLCAKQVILCIRD
ncbi:MAG: cold shock domain-containing protein [Erysipelotrichales bacterium]